MPQTMRSRCRVALLLAVVILSSPAHTWCILGFGQCAPSIVGVYTLKGNPNARLTITADKISWTVGSVGFRGDYVVKSFNRHNVSIEVSLPEKRTVAVIVEKDQISFGDPSRELILPGVWKKVGAKP
jgi:hypothetical protein